MQEPCCHSLSGQKGLLVGANPSVSTCLTSSLVSALCWQLVFLLPRNYFGVRYKDLDRIQSLTWVISAHSLCSTLHKDKSYKSSQMKFLEWLSLSRILLGWWFKLIVKCGLQSKQPQHHCLGLLKNGIAWQPKAQCQTLQSLYWEFAEQPPSFKSPSLGCSVLQKRAVCFHRPGKEDDPWCVIPNHVPLWTQL